MKKTILSASVVLVLALSPASIPGEGNRPSQGSIYLTGQIGLNTYVRTADPYADPFDAQRLPWGASFELRLTDHLGLGGTVMYDRWSDYLGMFGGKWSFRLFKPSLDIAYHLNTEKLDGLDLFAGANLGYSILSVGNELGNTYTGRLKSEPHLAPVLGAHLNFWKNAPGFLGRLSLTMKVHWSVGGQFSGVYGTIGLTYLMN